MPEDKIIKKDICPQQEARAKLRESFLRAINELQGEPVDILTYEMSNLKATFSGWKVDGTEVLVRDLETPVYKKIPSALLRNSDLLAITFERPVLLP